VIVEFFGPPGSGKTTVADALAARLREEGRRVDVFLSARPGEDCPGPGFSQGGAPANQSLIDPLRRLTRPVAQLIAAKASGSRANDSSTDALVAKLAGGRRLAALRMRQYLVRLSAAWRKAGNSDRITIFDQGYVQAVLSILLARERASEEDVMTMLSVAPGSDLAIRVDAPISEIEGRLKLREKALGRVGRLFESKLGEPIDHARAADWLQSGLRRTGRTVLRISSADQDTLRIELARVQREIDRVGLKETEPAS
jgi:hypothetical protein